MDVVNFQSFLKQNIGKPIHQLLKDNNREERLNHVYNVIVSMYGCDNISDLKIYLCNSKNEIEKDVNINIQNLFKKISKTFDIPVIEIEKYLNLENFDLDNCSLTEAECYFRILEKAVSLDYMCNKAKRFLIDTERNYKSRFIVVEGSSQIWSRFSIRSFFIGRKHYVSKCLDICSFEYLFMGARTLNENDKRSLKHIIKFIFTKIQSEYPDIPVMVLELMVYPDEIIEFMKANGLKLVNHREFSDKFIERGILNLEAFENNHMEH